MWYVPDCSSGLSSGRTQPAEGKMVVRGHESGGKEWTVQPAPALALFGPRRLIRVQPSTPTANTTRSRNRWTTITYSQFGTRAATRTPTPRAAAGISFARLDLSLQPASSSSRSFPGHLCLASCHAAAPFRPTVLQDRCRRRRDQLVSLLAFSATCCSLLTCLLSPLLLQRCRPP